MSFNQFNLDSTITKAVSACGYTKPTPIQIQSIPEIMNGNDLVACAQTGTGKTAAFVLPALHRIREQRAIRKPRVLILTPTRELAAQITQAAGKYGKFLRFNLASLVGGMSYRQQLRDLSRAVDIIVATPGRLLDHMENHRLDLTGIEMLVLDEADRMLDMGFIDDVKAIAKVTPRNRQTLLFSATVDGKLSQIIKQLLNEPTHIDLSGEKISPAQIAQEIYMADSPSHKNRLLEHLLANENIFKAIIFSATKIGADKLAGQLSDLGYAAAPLHGDLKQTVRNRTVDQLRKNKIQFIVATDVAARGIDIPDMTHVINYDLPRFNEDYVHRIGRTGRAGKSGIAISFALRNDQRHIDKIERYIGQKIQRAVIEGLEPSSKPSKSEGKAGRKGGKKSFGKSFKSDSGKSRYARDDAAQRGNRFGGEGKKRFARNDSASRGKDFGSEGKSRDDSAPRGKSFGGEGKRRFARDDSAPRGKSFGGEGKSRFARDDLAPRGKSFGGEGKSRFAWDDSAPRGKSFGGEGKSRFAHDDTAPRGKSRGGKGKSRFVRDDSPSRGKNFGGEGKSRFARDDASRSKGAPTTRDSKIGSGKFKNSKRFASKKRD